MGTNEEKKSFHHCDHGDRRRKKKTVCFALRANHPATRRTSGCQCQDDFGSAESDQVPSYAASPAPNSLLGIE